MWNWLPVFRLVAERESIRSAAIALRVAPSAVSRSVKLLEEHVGVTLFFRRGRALSLTGHGHRLLEVVRNSMRAVDDCLGGASEPAWLVCGMLDWLAPMFGPSLAVSPNPPSIRVFGAFADGIEELSYGAVDAFLAPAGPDVPPVLARLEIEALTFALYALGPSNARVQSVAAPVDTYMRMSCAQKLPAALKVPAIELLSTGTTHVLFPASHPFASAMPCVSARAAETTLALYTRRPMAGGSRASEIDHYLVAPIRACLAQRPERRFNRGR